MIPQGRISRDTGDLFLSFFVIRPVYLIPTTQDRDGMLVISSFPLPFISL